MFAHHVQITRVVSRLSHVRLPAVHIPPVPHPTAHSCRNFIEVFAFIGVACDGCGYFTGWGTLEGFAKIAALVAYVVVLIRHYEERKYRMTIEDALAEARRLHAEQHSLHHELHATKRTATIARKRRRRA